LGGFSRQPQCFTHGLKKTAIMKSFLNTFKDLPEEKGGLVFLLSLSALIKLTVFLLLIDKVDNPDSAFYVSVARKFAEGNFSDGFALYYIPVYPILIAILNIFVDEWVFSARLLSTIPSILIIIPCYLLSKELYGRKAAFWGCLAFSIMPAQNNWAISVVRDPLYVFFFIWSVYFAYLSINLRKLIYFGLAFLFLGFSIIIRFEGLILFFIYFMFLFYIIFKENRIGIWLIPSLLICPIILLLLFKVIAGLAGIDDFLAIRLHGVVRHIKGLLENGIFYNYGQYLSQFRLIGEDPVRGNGYFSFISRYIPFLYLFGFIEKFCRVIFPVFLIPLFLGVKYACQKGHSFIIVLVCSYLIILYFFYIQNDYFAKRYFYTSVVLVLPWIGSGFLQILESIKISGKKKYLYIVFVLFFLLIPIGDFTSSACKKDNSLNVAGRWILKQPEFTNLYMLVNDPRILLYANRDSFFILQGGDKWNLMEDHDFEKYEKSAIDDKISLIVIRLNKKYIKLLPEFDHYRKIKQIKGKKMSWRFTTPIII